MNIRQTIGVLTKSQLGNIISDNRFKLQLFNRLQLFLNFDQLTIEPRLTYKLKSFLPTHLFSAILVIILLISYILFLHERRLYQIIIYWTTLITNVVRKLESSQIASRLHELENVPADQKSYSDSPSCTNVTVSCPLHSKFYEQVFSLQR